MDRSSCSFRFSLYFECLTAYTCIQYISFIAFSFRKHPPVHTVHSQSIHRTWANGPGYGVSRSDSRDTHICTQRLVEPDWLDHSKRSYKHVLASSFKDSPWGLVSGAPLYLLIASRLVHFGFIVAYQMGHLHLFSTQQFNAVTGICISLFVNQNLARYSI